MSGIPETLDTVSRSKVRVAWRGLRTASVAALALLPIVIISLVGSWYAGRVRPLLPFELTNAEALRTVLAGALHPSVRADSWLPMRQALEVLAGPEHGRLYETLFFAGGVRFQYPPSSLLPIELLSVFGLSSIRILNAIDLVVFFANAAAVGLVTWLLFRGRRPSALGKLSTGGLAGVAALAALVFYPLLRADVLGQIQLWIDLAFTLALASWIMGWRLVAGLLIGLACTIKPQLGLLLLWAVLSREWRFGAALVLAAGSVGLVSLARYGWHNHVAYLEVLAFLSRHGESFFANNSVNGILNAYLSPDDPLVWNASGFTPFVSAVRAGTVVASVAALALLAVPPLLRRGRRAGPAAFCAAAICTVVGSPVAWEHHYGILMPMFAVALHGLVGLEPPSRRPLLLALFVAWVLVANFISPAVLLAGGPFRVLMASCFGGALLLLAILLRNPSDTVWTDPERMTGPQLMRPKTA